MLFSILRKSIFLRWSCVMLLGFLSALLLQRANLSARLIGLEARLLLPGLADLQRLKEQTLQIISAPWKINALTDQMRFLERALTRAVSENAALQELRLENASLRRALNFKEKITDPTVAAEVLGKLTEGGADFFVLNRGSQEGVQVEQAVVTEGIILGKIMKVSPQASLVAPITSPYLKVAAVLLSEEQGQGLVEGAFQVGLRMRFIPRAVAVHLEQTVITSGLEPQIPRGLVLGTVQTVVDAPDRLFQVAELKPAGLLAQARFVNIIIRQDVQNLP